MDLIANVVSEEHLRRRAFVYVRQSTFEQVRFNTGSTLVQLSQRDCIKRLGWDDDMIEVLTGDLGITGTDASVRDDWQQLLQAVGEDKVGLFAITATSRASRDRRDFADLVRLCRIYNVLILLDGSVINPNRPDQELLLNIRADVDQYDNEVRTKQLHAAKDKLMKEGSAMTAPPTGYVAIDKKGHKWQKDPNSRIQDAILAVFRAYAAHGSIMRAVRALRAANEQLPTRHRSGDVMWRDARTSRVAFILKNPAYAGYYVYGRVRVEPRAGKRTRGKQRGRWKCRSVDRSRWVLVPGHHDGYVQPEEFWAINERLRNGRFAAMQPPLQGRALLQGIIWCGDSKRLDGNFLRMQTRPSSHGNGPYYQCPAGRADAAGDCNQVAALRLDEAVLEHLFAALRELTPDVLTTATQQSEEEVRRQAEQYRRELEQAEERARVAEERCKRTPSSDAHVWSRLTGEWNVALEDLHQLQNRDARVLPPPTLTLDEVKELERIATRLDLLWSRLSNEDKKRVIRLLIRRVIYRNRDDISGELTIEWEVGSPTIQAFVPSGNIRHRVKALFDAGQTPEDIATTLNAQAVRPGTTARTRVFDAKAVRRLLWKRFRIRVKTHGQGRTATILALSTQGLGQTAIAQELARRGIQNRAGRPYTPAAVGAVIRRRSRRSPRGASVAKDTGHPGSPPAQLDGYA
jgi:DNA invertase Pin-like site-specific DNA recombinase